MVNTPFLWSVCGNSLLSHGFYERKSVLNPMVSGADFPGQHGTLAIFAFLVALCGEMLIVPWATVAETVPDMMVLHTESHAICIS
jgi:hypothetical protein